MNTNVPDSTSTSTSTSTSPHHSRIAFATIAQKIQSQHQRNNEEDEDLTTTTSSSIADARNSIFQLGAVVGQLCSLFLTIVPLDSTNSTITNTTAITTTTDNNRKLENQLGEVFLQLFRVACVCELDVRNCVLKKVELNGRKYPVELCKGKSGKYTNYSSQTGITTTVGQSTMHSTPPQSITTNTTTTTTDDDEHDTIEGITLHIRTFATARQWNKYHTPRNIALALLGEVGELAELFQWSGDRNQNHPTSHNGEPHHDDGDGGGKELLLLFGLLSEEDLDKIGQEIADVTIYLLRLADVCGVELGDVAMGLLLEE